MTHIFLKASSRSSKWEWVRYVDRAIHSMEFDSHIDAFFGRPSRDRLNFEQIEKAADTIISTSRFRRLTANDRRWRISINVHIRCILDKNLHVCVHYTHTRVYSRPTCAYIPLFIHAIRFSTRRGYRRFSQYASAHSVIYADEAGIVRSKTLSVDIDDVDFAEMYTSLHVSECRYGRGVYAWVSRIR